MVRLIIPVQIAYLAPPHKYYNEYQTNYEKVINDTKTISDLLKASYITELEMTLNANTAVFRKKSSFYYNAMLYALLSTIPYLICLGFHISKKEDQVHKVEIVKWGKNE